MTRKIIVSAPPGAGMRSILQFLEILVGSRDSIRLDENGGSHLENNTSMNAGPNTAHWKYIPFRPAEYCKDIPELQKFNHDVPYMFTSVHYSTSDIVNNIEKLKDWTMLKIDIVTVEEAQMAAVLNAIKYVLPYSGMSIKSALFKTLNMQTGLLEDHYPVENLPDNIVQASYFDFYKNPEPYLRRLIPEASDERVKLAVNAVNVYWKRQNED